jgi:hypothetical protein
MTGLRPVTVGVIGTGAASTELIMDTLNDQFEYGPADENGCFTPSETFHPRPVIPVGERYNTPAFIDVWDWAMRADLGFTALHDGTHGAQTQDILDSVEGFDDVQPVRTVAEALIMELRSGPNPLLLVLSDEGAVDEEAQEVAAAALRADIPVYDLSRAMLEITWRDLPDQEEPAGDAEVTEQPDGQMALVVDDETPDVTLSPQGAQLLREALTGAESLLALITTDLDRYVRQVGAQILAARAALAPRPEATPNKSGKGHLEVFDPETNTWRPAGRGRPKKDVRTQWVPH